MLQQPKQRSDIQSKEQRSPDDLNSSNTEKTYIMVRSVRYHTLSVSAALVIPANLMGYLLRARLIVNDCES